MTKETFTKIMKSLLDHTDGAEVLGEKMKEVVASRSTLTDFMQGFFTIFYDDKMVEDILRTLEEELEDKDELITRWFYEYRTMGMINLKMSVQKEIEWQIKKWCIGSDPDMDNLNLSILYDAIKGVDPNDK